MTDRFTKCMNVDRQNNLIDGVAEQKKTHRPYAWKNQPLSRLVIINLIFGPASNQEHP